MCVWLVALTRELWHLVGRHMKLLALIRRVCAFQYKFRRGYMATNLVCSEKSELMKYFIITMNIHQ